MIKIGINIMYIKKIIILIVLILVTPYTKSLLCNNKPIENFFNLPIPDQRKTFAQLSLEERQKLISKMTFQIYKKFLNAYSEHEWKNLLESLSVEEKKYWPQTVKKQRDDLDTIRKDADNTRDIALVLNVAAGTLFPPALLIQVAELAYVYKYNIHPIVHEQITKGFKKYLEKNFKIVFD